MGERGPAPDADQAAKGFPGKRRSKAQRAAEAAQRTAALLAPVEGAKADLPAMLADPKYAGAAEMWRRLAPELRRTHRLPRESEFNFTQLCIYAQEWVEATEDLHANGFSQAVKTVAGGKMERRRPRQFDRQQAYANCLELGARFGLTPHDMYALFKDQALVAARHPGLFGDERQAAQPAPAAEAEAPAEPAQPASRIAAMGRMRSPPPGETVQ